MSRVFALGCFLATVVAGLCGYASEVEVIQLWEKTPPGPPAVTKGEERDVSNEKSNLVAGEPLIRLTDVAKPELHIFRPVKPNGSACLICPGGGFHVLAWDLEGTEVAVWLNSIGVTAGVVKYRVPTASHGDADKWRGPVIDTQRAISIMRANAKDWQLDEDRIGVLGFSAGGCTAARTALQHGERLYKNVDDADTAPCDANFAVLVYPAYLTKSKEDDSLRDDLTVNEKSPPTFLVHAANDRVTCASSVSLFMALKRANRPAELHVYATGGHGYGLRPTAEDVTKWPERTGKWLGEQGFLQETKASEDSKN